MPHLIQCVARQNARPLAHGAIEGHALGLQEYIARRVAADPTNADAILALPDTHGAPAADERGWIRLQLMYVAALTSQIIRDLNVPWLVRLAGVCSPAHATCVAMQVGDDIYVCPAHGDGRACTAFAYTEHALELVSHSLVLPYAAPALPIAVQHRRTFGAPCKQLARIFLHMYCHHPALFAECEASSALYARFRLLCTRYALYPAEELPRTDTR